MASIRKVVEGLAYQSEKDLKQTRVKIQNSTMDRQTQAFVLDLIDLFIRVGPDEAKRKKALKHCLKRLDKNGRGSSPGGCSKVIVFALAGAALIWLLL